jgi:hypothetical protein
LVSDIKIAFLLTPPLLFVSTFVSNQNLYTKDGEFFQKWGSFFLEFKNNKGFLSSQFYLIFFTRRLVYLISQVFLNSHLFIQGALHILFSITQLIFDLYYLPFKETPIMISSLFSELSMTIIFISTYLFLFNISDQLILILEQLCTFTVIGCLMGQLLISVFVTVQRIKMIIKKIAKAQIKAFLKTAASQDGTTQLESS